MSQSSDSSYDSGEAIESDEEFLDMMLYDDDSAIEAAVVTVVTNSLVLQRQQLQRAVTPKITREYTPRGRVSGGHRLFADYFQEIPVYGESFFRRRFRMRHPLFNRILEAVKENNSYFVQGMQCTGEPGLTTHQKIVAAVQILASGSAADTLDEYIRIGETTILECLREFSSTVVRVFRPEYLREPTSADMHDLFQVNGERGFPGMLGSIDCMHWQWKNCPKSWHGAYVSYKKKPSIVLEAVASHNTWIWHAFFGMPGSYNDINVLRESHVFDRMLKGDAPRVNFEINGHTYKMPYFLADGIYPKYGTLVSTCPSPLTEKEKIFAKKHESVRKDVELAFGILQARWGFVR